MNEPDTLAPSERELAATLRATLERKAAAPDPLLDAALAATRARIGTRKHPVRHPWWLAGGFAVAASLAMVVVMLPDGTSRQGPAPGQTVAGSVAMPDADLQFLQDLDMLVAMNGKGS